MYVVPFFFHEIKIWRLFRQTVRRIEVVNIFHFSILNSCTLTYLRDVLSPFHENSFENAVNFISYLLAYRHVFVFLRKLLPRSYFPLIIWRMFSRNGKYGIFSHTWRTFKAHWPSWNSILRQQVYKYLLNGYPHTFWRKIINNYWPQFNKLLAVRTKQKWQRFKSCYFSFVKHIF